MLITGAGGYIGGRLVPTLRESGLDVHALVREPAPRLGVQETVCDLADCDSNALEAACEGAQTVVHLAGENELIASQAPAAALAGTLVATENLSEACVAAGVRRLVYMSTVHVYGDRMESGAVLREDMRAEPRSAYSISRLASEHVAATLARDAYELVILRLTNSVGAPDDPSVNRWSLVSNDLCRQGSLTGRLTLRSSGVQWRDFVPLSAVCSAILAAAHVEQAILPPGVYNLGSGRPSTVRGLAEMIQDAFEQLTGERPALDAPEPPSDRPAPYHVSVERAAQRGVRLDAPLEEAVMESVRFCVEHREEIR